MCNSSSSRTQFHEGITQRKSRRRQPAATALNDTTNRHGHHGGDDANCSSADAHDVSPSSPWPSSSWGASSSSSQKSSSRAPILDGPFSGERSRTIRQGKRMSLVVVVLTFGLVLALLSVSDNHHQLSDTTAGTAGINTAWLRVQRRLGTTAAEARAAMTEERIGKIGHGSNAIAGSGGGGGSIRIITLPDSVRQSIEHEFITSKIQVDVTNLSDLERFIIQVKHIVESHIREWDASVLDTLLSLVADDNDENNRSNGSSGAAAGATKKKKEAPISAILLRNLPRDPYVPPTPTDGSTTLGKTTYIAEGMLLGFGELTSSSVVGYESETQYSNPWVHEGFPYRPSASKESRDGKVRGGGEGGDAKKEGTGSALTMAKGMNHHQDMSYHPSPPDLLGLYCLREGHDTKLQTTLIHNQDVLNSLPDKTVDILKQERFQIHASEWVDTTTFSIGHERRSIVSPTSDAIALPVDWSKMIALDDEASVALEMLQEAVHNAPTYPVHLVDGDLVLFNNRRVVHARNDYNDLRFDGGDRVVNRAYFIRRERASWEERRKRLI